MSRVPAPPPRSAPPSPSARPPQPPPPPRLRRVVQGGVLAALAAAGVAATSPSSPRFEVPAPREGAVWLKGNTHTHTTESDGDSPPEAVARWYRDHGYDFLVLSDHNVLTDPARLAHLQDSAFLLIRGEEVTSAFEGAPVHVNGLNVEGLVEPRVGSTLLETVQENVDAVREARGVPHVNHPNFRWAIPGEVLAAVEGDRLLEIHNGHPTVHNRGGGGIPGMEAVWDALLTGGKRVYGIAVDDAHHFLGEFSPDRANPGRGWVVVRSEARDARAILAAMEEGRFYASTGPELEDVRVSPHRIEVHVRQRGDFRYETEFVGDGGRVLKRTGGNPAVYEIDGPVSYVRARVTDSRGDVAWVQPIFVRR